jgi:hypothetical protein
MFQGKNMRRILSDKYHLSEMIAVLGHPPLEFLERSKNSFNYFDERGQFCKIAPRSYDFMPSVLTLIIHRELERPRVYTSKLCLAIRNEIRRRKQAVLLEIYQEYVKMDSRRAQYCVRTAP